MTTHDLPPTCPTCHLPLPHNSSPGAICTHCCEPVMWVKEELLTPGEMAQMEVEEEMFRAIAGCAGLDICIGTPLANV